MFLFNSLHRMRMRIVFAFIVMTMVFLTLACSTEVADTGFVLEGKWESPYDSYTITKTTIDYLMDNSAWGFPDTILKGSIEKAVNFSGNAGALIIKVTESSDFTPGKYAGVYYRDGTKKSIKMATAFNADYSPLEKDTLSEAESLFTVDSALIEMWGSYTK
jgi:hypothetical protein